MSGHRDNRRHGIQRNLPEKRHHGFNKFFGRRRVVFLHDRHQPLQIDPVAEYFFVRTANNQHIGIRLFLNVIQGIYKLLQEIQIQSVFPFIQRDHGHLAIHLNFNRHNYLLLLHILETAQGSLHGVFRIEPG